jgi:hypothetical protein
MNHRIAGIADIARHPTPESQDRAFREPRHRRNRKSKISPRGGAEKSKNPLGAVTSVCRPKQLHFPALGLYVTMAFHSVTSKESW